MLVGRENQDAYFTIHSLKAAGFHDELDSLSLGDLFYASVLKLDKRFTWQKIGGMPVFSLSRSFFETRDFLRTFIVKEGPVSVSDMSDQLEKRFGIVLRRDKILEKTHGEGLYYDPVMDKLYAGYNVFKEENSTLLGLLDQQDGTIHHDEIY